MQKIRAIFFKKSGTITLFAALSMTFLVVFFMVLVDISRLFLFSKITESSTKLASLSVMSAYDQHLYERYGLFGRGGTDGNELAKRTMRKNLVSELNIFDIASPLSLVPVELSSVDVIYDYYLGQHDELEHQIVKEMKYKAPIDFSIEVIESFSALEEATKISNSLVSSMKSLEDLFEKREAQLQKALTKQKEIAKLKSSFPLDQQFSSIVNGYSSYISNVNHEQSLLEELYELTKKDEKELTKQDKKNIELLSKQINDVRQIIEQYLASSNNYLAKSEQNQSKYSEKLSSLSIELEDSFSLAKTYNTTLSIQYDLLVMKQQQAANESTSTITAELQMALSSDQLVRPSKFFDSYNSEIESQIKLFNDYKRNAAAFSQAARQAIHQPNKSLTSNAAMNSSYTTLTSTTSLLTTNYISPATVLANRENEINIINSVKNQLKNDKDEYKQLLASSNYISQLAIVLEQLEKDKETFNKIEHYANRNLERNLQLKSGNLPGQALNLGDEGTDNAKKGLGHFSSMLSTIKMTGNRLQAHLYRSEYIMHRFSHLPLGELDKLIRTNKDNINFNNQAVEYVLIGMSEPTANVSIVMAEIFAIRLAIRTIEGLIANKHLAHPLLILSASVLYGLKHALSDMNELMTKGKTELSKYVKVDISYPLYLRLLASIHGIARGATLSRIAAVIEHDLELDLMQVATSTIVVTHTKTKLWMLPSVSKLISQHSSDFIGVENGYYEKSDYASTSY